MELDNDNDISSATPKPMIFTESGTVGGPIVNGVIAAEDPSDFFRFEATTDGTLWVRLTNIEGDVLVRIYDENGVRIASDGGIFTTAKSMSFNVDAGRTYFIELEHWYHHTETEFTPTSYDLQTTISPYQSLPDTNNSFDTASVWTVEQFNGGGGSFLRGFGFDGSQFLGGPEDSTDFFTFTATQRDILTVKLTDLGGAFDIRLYDASRNLLAESDVGGVAPEYLSLEVAANEQYYIEIAPEGDAQGRYRIDARFGDGDEFFDTAREIDIFNISNNSLSQADTRDILTFDAHATGIFTVNLVGLTKDFDLFAYGPDQTLLDSSTNSTLGNDTVSFATLEGQRYYLRVETKEPFDALGGGNGYSLTSSFRLQPEDGNDTRAEAEALTTPSLTSGEIGGNDRNDFYSFIAPESGRADLTLSGLTANADLRVYTTDGELIAASVLNSKQQEFLSVGVVSGETYFVRINTPTASITDYDLRLSFAARSFDADAEVASGRESDRSLLLGERITGDLDQARDSDWYAITVPENATYVVRAETAEGSTLANPDMVLRSSDGAFVDQDTDDDGKAAEFILSEPGTYYVDVRSYSGDTGTYTLVAQSTFVQTTRLDDSDDVPGGVDSDAVLIFGDPIAGRLGSTTDSDWFKLEVVEDDTVTVELAGSAARAGTLSEGTIVLRTADGSFVDQVSSDPDANASVTISDPGTYWIDVRSHNELSGSYQLIATSSNQGENSGGGTTTPEGPDTAGNVTTSIQLFPGSIRTESIETSSDSDWFKIVNLPGDTLTVTISGSGTDALTDPDLVLRGILGGFVDQDVGRPGENVVFELGSAGTFFLDVRSYGGDTGSYTISVEDSANGSSPAVVQTENFTA